MKCFYSMLWLSLLFCIGCKETEESILVDALLLSNNRIAVDSYGGSTTIAITSSSKWKATTAAEWIECIPDSSHLVIRVKPNAEDSIRSAEILVATSTISEVIEVKQEGMNSGTSFRLFYDESKCVMDSEGDEFTVTVMADTDWEVTVDNVWFTIDRREEANRFTVTVPQNQGTEQQRAILTVTAGYVTRRIELIQQTRSENGFYALEGLWNWNASAWFYGNEILGNGVNASCRLEAYVYNQQYKLWDLFLNGIGMFVTYNPETAEVTLPLGWAVGSNTSYVFYLCGVNIDTKNLTFEGALTLIPDAGKLTVKSSVSDMYPYVGIVGYNGQTYTLFNNLCYVLTEGSVLEKAAEQSAVSAVAKANYEKIIPGIQGNNVRKRGYATFEMPGNRNY